MSRSYSTFRERQPFTDGWKEATYSGMAPSDQVHRPFILDTEGKRMPIIRYASGSNGERYVIKAEIVEHTIVPYRYGWRPSEEFRDFEVEDRHLGSNYKCIDQNHHYPDKKIEELINQVLDEACRGPTAPVAHDSLTNAWRSGPNRSVQENNRKYDDDERNFRRDDHKKLNDNPNWGRHNEPYLNTHPIKESSKDVYEFYGRPQENEVPNARSRPLSKPTNEISTAMPSYGNGKEKEKEFNTSSHNEVNRPTMTIPLDTTRWRIGSNMSGPNTKVEPPKDYHSESEEEEEESRHRLSKRDELKVVNNRGGEKPDGYENPKRIAAAVQFGQTPGKKKNPEKFDRREASRRFGKPSAQPKEEERYEGTITSKEAVKKYNGALVPR